MTREGNTRKIFSLIQLFFLVSMIIGISNINATGYESENSLLRDIKDDNFESARILVEKGADVNVQDHYGITPLMIAVIKNNLEMTNYLIEKGADINKTTEWGYNALYLAENIRNHEIINLLKKHGLTDPMPIIPSDLKEYINQNLTNYQLPISKYPVTIDSP
jgi:ankyrin repeat protein